MSKKYKNNITTLQEIQENKEIKENEDSDDEKEIFNKLIITLKDKINQINILKNENLKANSYNKALEDNVVLLANEIKELQRQIKGFENYIKLKNNNKEEYKKSIDDVLERALDTSLQIAEQEILKNKSRYDDEAKEYANNLLQRLGINLNK